MEKWIFISSIATGVIALFAACSFWLAWKINIRDNEYRQQIEDLFQAITISNMLSGPHEVTSDKLEKRIKQFNKWYKGAIRVFPEDKFFE